VKNCCEGCLAYGSTASALHVSENVPSWCDTKNEQKKLFETYRRHCALSTSCQILQVKHSLQQKAAKTQSCNKIARRLQANTSVVRFTRLGAVIANLQLKFHKSSEAMVIPCT